MNKFTSKAKLRLCLFVFSLFNSLSFFLNGCISYMKTHLKKVLPEMLTCMDT